MIDMEMKDALQKQFLACPMVMHAGQVGYFFTFNQINQILDYVFMVDT